MQTKLCRGLVKRDIFFRSAALNVTTACRVDKSREVDTSLSIANCAMEPAGKSLTLRYGFRRCPNGSI
ncbi:MAG: hypothetical protein PVI20_18155, partial [Desulfobacteraceae bacterium]